MKRPFLVLFYLFTKTIGIAQKNRLGTTTQISVTSPIKASITLREYMKTSSYQRLSINLKRLFAKINPASTLVDIANAFQRPQNVKDNYDFAMVSIKDSRDNIQQVIQMTSQLMHSMQLTTDSIVKNLH